MEPLPAPKKHPTKDYIEVSHPGAEKTWQWTRYDSDGNVVSSSGTPHATRKAAEAEALELNTTIKEVSYV